MMSVPVLRNLVSWMLIVLLPASLLAADTGSALLHSNGGVWVNGAEVADSTVVFPGDSLETKPGFVANLDSEGSSVLIQGQSIVKFEGSYLTLEHGSLAVGTSTSMSVHVNCLRVEPLSNDRTQYEVTDVSGSVQVAARKNDVNIKQAGGVHKDAEAVKIVGLVHHFGAIVEVHLIGEPRASPAHDGNPQAGRLRSLLRQDLLDLVDGGVGQLNSGRLNGRRRLNRAARSIGCHLSFSTLHYLLYTRLGLAQNVLSEPSAVADGSPAPEKKPIRYRGRF